VRVANRLPRIGRFFADSEALYSYEGTFQIQNLIVGKAITGLSAFCVIS
jgi:glutaryl-CoA dehydrogenase